MARKKAEPAPTPAKLVTTYADSVELVGAPGVPLKVTDLKALVNAVENELFLDLDRTQVSLVAGYVGEYSQQPDRVRVSQVTTSTEVLDG